MGKEGAVAGAGVGAGVFKEATASRMADRWSRSREARRASRCSMAGKKKKLNFKVKKCGEKIKRASGQGRGGIESTFATM